MFKKLFYLIQCYLKLDIREPQPNQQTKSVALMCWKQRSSNKKVHRVNNSRIKLMRFKISMMLFSLYKLTNISNFKRLFIIFVKANPFIVFATRAQIFKSFMSAIN